MKEKKNERGGGKLYANEITGQVKRVHLSLLFCFPLCVDSLLADLCDHSLTAPLPGRMKADMKCTREIYSF
jgi:hypothetical protein